jgi:hypothetical protein
MLENLDQDAWDRWKAYRTAIRKPIKPASEHAMQLKLSKFGADQGEVVDQSIANQWQGLFEPKRAKPLPGEKPKKSAEQLQADDAAFTAQKERAARNWAEHEKTPYGRLKIADALWARYTIAPDIDTDDKLEWLKTVVAKELREVNARQVLHDPHLMVMVAAFFGQGGVRRIHERAIAT